MKIDVVGAKPGIVRRGICENDGKQCARSNVGRAKPTEFSSIDSRFGSNSCAHAFGAQEYEQEATEGTELGLCDAKPARLVCLLALDSRL